METLSKTPSMMQYQEMSNKHPSGLKYPTQLMTDSAYASLYYPCVLYTASCHCTTVQYNKIHLIHYVHCWHLHSFTIIPEAAQCKHVIKGIKDMKVCVFRLIGTNNGDNVITRSITTSPEYRQYWINRAIAVAVNTIS